MPKRLTVHVLSHTHWDREWYQPFQSYRKRLLFQTGKLLDLLESKPAYKHFHFDGQTALLEDHLAVRPQDRPRLERLIHAGRILVGPWYVMPDELLLSGESLVRNLMRGTRLARDFGGRPMSCGYAVDVFGHVSQLPQILAGFGITAAMLHRGTSGHEEQAEMSWVGADGTRCLLLKVHLWSGYNDFISLTRWDKFDLPEYERQKLEFASSTVAFALDGNDHAPADPEVPELIRDLNQRSRDLRFVHSSMPKFLRAVRKAMGARWWQGRKRLRGELRSPARQGMHNQSFNGIGSSRPYLKQWNTRIETMLTQWAEPFHGFARTLGADDQAAFLDLAWRYLLLNHPHDSIVGCSVDDVHRDMLYRFRQAWHLTRDATNESLLALAGAADTASLPRGEPALVLFRAAPSGDPVTVVDVDVPRDVAAAARDEGLLPRVFDERGEALAAQLVEVREKAPPAFPMKKTLSPRPIYGNPAGRPGAAGPVDRLRMAVEAPAPAYGYRALGFGFAEGDGPAPVETVAVGDRSMENAHLRVTVRPDGRWDLADKARGITYRGLGGLEDAEDAGHGWNFIPPGSDRDGFDFRPARVETTLSRGAKARVRGGPAGPLYASLEIRFDWRVPDHSPGARRGRMATLAVTTTLALAAGSPALMVRTVIANTASRHRVRVRFPTKIDASSYFADTAYDLVERPVRVPDTRRWKEHAFPWGPMKGVLAMHDGRRGLAILTRGLQEGGVEDTARRTMTLTLFRSFIERIGGTETVDSRLLGDVASEYALVPFAPDAGWQAGLLTRCRHLNAPERAILIDKAPGEEPTARSFLELDGPVVVEAVKVDEDGKGRRVVRLLNPSEEKVTARVRLAGAGGKAWQARLDETHRRPLRVRKDGAVTVRLKPKEVATVIL